LLVGVAACVDDRDGGVTGKVLEKRLLGVSELLGWPRADTKHADQLAAAHDRHADHVHFPRGGPAGVGQVAVATADRLAELQDAAGQAVTARQLGVKLRPGYGMARRGADDVALRHVQPDRAVVRANQLAGTFHQPREERLERELAGDLLDHLRQQLELCSDVGIDVNRGTVDGGGHEPGRLRA